ncbi:hypothetical protein [Anaeromicropila populeti]|uniref:Uncharacterized protein n=1 Tax=Anaeromicropila populeti TaxID=37658 RepID=A0A1I6JA46_9FIRM|nr:hypothetical protein [Anaeromicropila populeti]SFR75824.1 hypothetical protein SAMN05661086_01497 [Anaeromicropila populeti]
MMSDKELWSLFEKSGAIHDYLNYACTSEDSLCQEIEMEEGSVYDEPE